MEYDEAWGFMENLLNTFEKDEHLKRNCKIAFDHAWNMQQLKINELKEED